MQPTSIPTIPVKDFEVQANKLRANKHFEHASSEQTAGQNKGIMSSSSSSDEYYCTYEEYLNDLHEDKMYDLEAEQELEKLEYERALVDEQEWHDWIEEKQAIERHGVSIQSESIPHGTHRGPYS